MTKKYGQTVAQKNRNNPKIMDKQGSGQKIQEKCGQIILNNQTIKFYEISIKLLENIFFLI